MMEAVINGLVSPQINELRKSMDWFLYDNDLRHERVNRALKRERVNTQANIFINS